MTHLADTRSTEEDDFDINHTSSLIPADLKAVEFLPTDAPAGSSAKVEVLIYRYHHGLPLWHPDDRTDYSGLGKLSSLMGAENPGAGSFAKAKAGGRAGNHQSRRNERERLPTSASASEETLAGTQEADSLHTAPSDRRVEGPARGRQPETAGNLQKRLRQMAPLLYEEPKLTTAADSALNRTTLPPPELSSESEQLSPLAGPPRESRSTIATHAPAPSSGAQEAPKPAQLSIPAGKEAVTRSSQPEDPAHNPTAQTPPHSRASEEFVLPGRYTQQTEKIPPETVDTGINLERESLPQILPFHSPAALRTTLPPEISRLHQSLIACVASGGIRLEELERFEREHGIAESPSAPKPKYLA